MTPDTGFPARQCASAARLTALGWDGFFADQVTAAEAGLTPARIAGVHRTKLAILSTYGAADIAIDGDEGTAVYAVGDWVLIDITQASVVRRLERRTVLQRRIEGKAEAQLAAANVDTLFIVTSCNADFNLARLERYLAMANEAGTTPVIVLTKVDLIDDAGVYDHEARALQRNLAVVTLNAKGADVVERLSAWCGEGVTVALAGSSGVGKSTLVNALSQVPDQATGAIREGDAKGRHTTNARSLHEMIGGGWVIDNPGMRNLHVSHLADGISTTFAEIVDLAADCKFRNCAHLQEPGCAVQAAVAAGRLDEARLSRWRKLSDENRTSTPQATGPRGNKKPAQGKR